MTERWRAEADQIAYRHIMSPRRALNLVADILRLVERVQQETCMPSDTGRTERRPLDHRCPGIGADTLQGAFVAGAKWWEYRQVGASMWASDRDLAWAEAEHRYGSPEGE